MITSFSYKIFTNYTGLDMKYNVNSCAAYYNGAVIQPFEKLRLVIKKMPL